MEDNNDDIRSEKVKEFFEKPNLYLHRRFGIRLRSEFLREALTLNNVHPKRILDVGCGDGSLSFPLQREATKITLLDLSNSMLSIARKKFHGFQAQAEVRYIQGNFLDLGLADSYDLILAIGLLAHVDDVEQTIERFRVLTRDKGYVALQFSESGGGRMATMRLFRKTSYSLNKLTIDQVRSILANHGFEIVYQRKYMLRVPGMGRLPDGWLYRAQIWLAFRSFLASLFTDYFLLAKRK